MSEPWIDCTVSDIASSDRNALVGGPFGSNLVSRDYVDNGVPVIRGQNMATRWVSGDFVFVSKEKAQQLSANLARPGDLVFTQRGTLGQVALVPTGPFESYVVSQSQMKLTPDLRKTDPLFLYYLFSSPHQLNYIQQNAIQVGVPHTNLGILRNTPLSLPPLDRQKRIASILGSLDDKIELNRRMNATLESMAQAIFKSWFIDFDPVHRNAARLTEQHLTKSNLPDASRSFDHLFPDSFEDSQFGLIPKGWRVGPLSGIAEIIMGTSPKSSTYNEVGDGIPLINGPVEFGERFPVKIKWTTAPTKICARGDLIFCVRGSTTGRSVISDDVYCLGRGVCAIRSTRDAQAFVNQTVYSQLERMLAGVTGSVFPSLSTPQIHDFTVLHPNTKTAKRHAELARPIMDAIASYSRSNMILSAQRNVLLSHLLAAKNFIQPLLSQV